MGTYTSSLGRVMNRFGVGTSLLRLRERPRRDSHTMKHPYHTTMPPQTPSTLSMGTTTAGCCCFGFARCCDCISLLESLSKPSPICWISLVAFSITRGVELSHLCQASFSARIAASFLFSSSISRWLISNCCFFMR
jgi:hypothetical protein